MTLMPLGESPKCDFLNCAAGAGLAGNGICFFRGEWDNPDCPKFFPETVEVLWNLVCSQLQETYGGEVEAPYRDREMWDLWYGWF